MNVGKKRRHTVETCNAHAYAHARAHAHAQTETARAAKFQAAHLLGLVADALLVLVLAPVLALLVLARQETRRLALVERRRERSRPGRAAPAVAGRESEVDREEAQEEAARGPGHLLSWCAVDDCLQATRPSSDGSRVDGQRFARRTSPAPDSRARAPRAEGRPRVVSRRHEDQSRRHAASYHVGRPPRRTKSKDATISLCGRRSDDRAFVTRNKPRGVKGRASVDASRRCGVCPASGGRALDAGDHARSLRKGFRTADQQRTAFLESAGSASPHGATPRRSTAPRRTSPGGRTSP